MNIDALKAPQRAAARRVFQELRPKTLKGFAHLADGPVRRELDRGLLAEVLGSPADALLDRLAGTLSREPTLTSSS